MQRALCTSHELGCSTCAALLASRFEAPLHGRQIVGRVQKQSPQAVLSSISRALLPFTHSQRSMTTSPSGARLSRCCSGGARLGKDPRHVLCRAGGHQMLKHHTNKATRRRTALAQFDRHLRCCEALQEVRNGSPDSRSLEKHWCLTRIREKMVGMSAFTCDGSSLRGFLGLKVCS